MVAALLLYVRTPFYSGDVDGGDGGVEEVAAHGVGGGDVVVVAAAVVVVAVQADDH